MSQMALVSKAFVSALTGSYVPYLRADLWDNGELIEQNLPVSAGSVSTKDGQRIRTSLNCTIADPGGKLRPATHGSKMSPYGPELNIRSGIQLSGGPESVSLGWFPITSVKAKTSWRTYRQEGTPDVRVPSSTIQVTARDRLQWVSTSGLLGRQQPQRDTVFDEIARLLRGVAPWRKPQGISDKGIPSTVTYQQDRLDAIRSLADLVDADPICTPGGAITLASRGRADWSEWTVAGGDDGVLVDWEVSLTQDGTYNLVGLTGQKGDTLEPIIGSARIKLGPLRWRQGLQLTHFESAPMLKTRAELNAAAATKLAKLSQQRAHTLAVECSANPAIDAGDTVLLDAPKGSLLVRIAERKFPLTPGRMNLTVSADPTALARVT